MSCPRISHVVPLRPEVPVEGSHRSRRGRSRSERLDSFHGATASTRLSRTICPEAREASTSTSIYSIPSSLRLASRLTASSSGRSNVGEARGDLDRAVEAYNGAVRTWRNYELGRPAGSAPSTMVGSLEWAGIRQGLVAAATERGFRLEGLEESPGDQLLFRPEEEDRSHMSNREVSGAVLRLTRLRNRIRSLDTIEDDAERPARDRLAAARSAVALTREATLLVDQLRDRAPNPRDPRILRLSNEILHVACDDPNTAEVMSMTNPEWVASVVRLYNQTAEGAIRAAYHDRADGGADNRIFQARLHLLRARRASYALSLSDDPVAATLLRSDLDRTRVALQRDLTRETGRIVREDVREARRLLTRADAVLGHPRRPVSPARLEAARADYRRGLEILNRLAEFSATDPRVARLRGDGRWARLESAASAAA